MGWALSGFALHIMTKITNAKRVKPGFSIGTFWVKNWMSYLTSLVAIYIYVALMSAGHLPDTDPLTLVALGYGGGSIMKNLLKRKENG